MSYWLALALVFGVLGVILLSFAIAVYLVRPMLGGDARRSTGLARFLIRYTVVFGLLLGLETLFLQVLPSFHESLRGRAAALIGGILRLVGTEASVDGPLILVGTPSAAFEITVACLGGLLFWVYLGLVMAESRATGKQRLMGVLIGLSILAAFNILRICISVYVEGSAGIPIHDWFYLINMLVVLLVWAGWVRSLRPPANHEHEVTAQCEE